MEEKKEEKEMHDGVRVLASARRRLRRLRFRMLISELESASSKVEALTLCATRLMSHRRRHSVDRINGRSASTVGTKKRPFFVSTEWKGAAGTNTGGGG
ncbi:hypothetical protein RB213_013052 [Colletotrichum asianum]